MVSRRRFLLGVGAALATAARPGRGAAVEYARVVPRPLVFPRDHGAHGEFRNEWWYLTGWLRGEGGLDRGFQVTFFRTRTDVDPANPSAFAARQLLIAHAALADPGRGRLLHAERIARAGFHVAEASDGDTDVYIGPWRLAREPATDAYAIRLPAGEFTLDLRATPVAPPLLQGEGGLSRKGPLPGQASYYYSRPQLAVRGTVEVAGRREACAGVGWLDHEWSSTLLAADAAGWDWVGMNLADGRALTAFQVRRQGAAGDDAPIHAYGAIGPPGGPLTVLPPGAVRFTPRERWTSPRTGAAWPVVQALDFGDRRFEIRPLFPDQELDSRGSVGSVYWEGASRLLENGREAGRGYLEMTGYVEPLRL